jgi:triacylglycerol lipase
VVFAHGIIGVDGPLSLIPGINYFLGVEKALRDLPVDVHFARVPTGETIEKRASVLAQKIASIDASSIAIIAHSMGGLDSRQVINRHAEGERVYRLVTIATPHRGTPITPWVLASRKPWWRMLSRWISSGLKQLDAKACEEFNARTPDRDHVKYESYACVRPIEEMPFWAKGLARVMQPHCGANDSQVCSASASWGEFLGELRADHLEVIGWSIGLRSRRQERPFDHRTFYRDLVQRIISEWDD